MKSKLMTTCFLATVFSASIPAIVPAQANDLRCKNNDTLLGSIAGCDDSKQSRKWNLDPTTTNSVSVDNRGNSVAGDKHNASANTNDSADSTAPTSSDASNGETDDGGATAADNDHDNGHGNDQDHDDSSNPGQGGGNHGTGNNGGGKGGK